MRYLKDLVLRQRDVLDRAKQELIAYKEMQRYVGLCGPWGMAGADERPAALARTHPDASKIAHVCG